MTQSGEQFQPGITVCRLHADFLLEREDGPNGVAAGAAVDAVGFEPLLVEPPLDFLDLVQRGHTFAAGELLAEGRVAADQVAKMSQSQRVAR